MNDNDRFDSEKWSKVVTRVQLAMEETRQTRENEENKRISEHDMVESILKKPTPGKIIMEMCRRCSNYDVVVRARCWNKACPAWIFRQGGKGSVTEKEMEEYLEAVRSEHEKTEIGATPCNKLRGGWLKSSTKNSAKNA